MLTSYYSQWLYAVENVQFADEKLKNTSGKQSYSKLLYYNNSSSHEILHLLAFINESKMFLFWNFYRASLSFIAKFTWHTENKKLHNYKPKKLQHKNTVL